jgi:hypothetical protein
MEDFQGITATPYAQMFKKCILVLSSLHVGETLISCSSGYKDFQGSEWMASKGLERTTINDIQMLERRDAVHHFFRYELQSITSFNFEAM